MHLEAERLRMVSTRTGLGAAGWVGSASMVEVVFVIGDFLLKVKRDGVVRCER